MSSVGETIVAAMVAALNTPSPRPATTWRTRIDAFGSQELPAMVLYTVKEAVSTESNKTVMRTRTVRLEMIVAGEPPADALIDPLYTYAMGVFDAIDNRAVGFRRMREALIQWETEASYQDSCIAVVDFEVVYVTLAGDPSHLVTG